ncbi:MAG: peptidoglycan-binding domain-containing protein [Pseudomonadota bacterium]
MQKGYLWILVPTLLLVAVIVINLDGDDEQAVPPPDPEPPAPQTVDPPASDTVPAPVPEPDTVSVCDGEEVLVGLLVEDSLALERSDVRVRRLQIRLRDEGIFRGTIDGVLGTNTRVAIYRYQQRSGRCPSGYVDDVAADLLAP